MEPSCVKMQYSRGVDGRESGQALLLVLANKHINSKVDNQVGWGERGAAPGVKRAVQREQSWPVQSLSRGGGGGDTARSETQLKVWSRNFTHPAVAEIPF